MNKQYSVKGLATIEVNSNFRHVAGEEILKNKDRRFAEYREKWQTWPLRFYAGDFPLFIDIEATSACNLKCSFCATTFRGKTIRKGLISYDTVKSVIDEGADNNLYGVKFNIRGEPLLHPRIAEFVRYAKKHGLIDVYFNTNAMLLTEGISRKLIDAGLDRISISFEGYTKDVYERYRAGATYETVLANIEKLNSLKRSMNVEHPKVRIQTVMLPEIESDFGTYKEFWQSRANEVALLDYKEMKEKKRGVPFKWACPQIWQRMAVWWDGTILPCNHDDDGLLELGKINKTTLKHAWKCAKLKELRDAHKSGLAHEVPSCDGCYLRDSEILKLQEREGANG
ncbi:MAG: radical SAM protein [Candidatus Omnitrophota bacterium]